MSDNPHMYGGGESYSAVVPAKHSNKGGRLPAEDVEGRAADQGEHGPVQPVPNTESGKRAKRAGGPL